MQELSPVVQALEDLRVPRALASLISMLALLAVIYGVTSAYGVDEALCELVGGMRVEAGG